MEKIWNWELSRINSYKKIPVDGSCFVIGKKWLPNPKKWVIIST